MLYDSVLQKKPFRQITVLVIPALSSPGLQAAAAAYLNAIKHLEISHIQSIIGK